MIIFAVFVDMVIKVWYQDGVAINNFTLLLLLCFDQTLWETFSK